MSIFVILQSKTCDMYKFLYLGHILFWGVIMCPRAEKGGPNWVWNVQRGKKKKGTDGMKKAKEKEWLKPRNIACGIINIYLLCLEIDS